MPVSPKNRPQKPKRRVLLKPVEDQEVFRTLEDLEDRFTNRPLLHGMGTMVGARAPSTGIIRWFSWSSRRGGFVNVFDTNGAGHAYTPLEDYHA